MRKTMRLTRSAGKERMDTFDQAIEAHEEWKALFERTLREGARHVPLEVMRVNRCCPLGDWLRRTQPGPAADRAAFEVLRDVHAGFHAAADRVLDLALAGHTKEAAATLAEGTSYSDWSAMLVFGLKHYAKRLAEPASE